MVKDFLIAAGNYKKYGELLKRRGLRVFAYVLLLLVVCSIGLIIVPTVSLGTRTVQVLWEDIPEFTITQEGMTIDREFNLDISGVKLVATNDREVTEEELGDSITGVLMDRDTVIMRNFDRTLAFSYNEFGEEFTVTKNHLRLMKPMLYLSGLMVFVMLFFSYALSYVLYGLFIGAVASLVAAFMKIRLPIGKYISLAMYSLTLPYVLFAVMTPLGISFFQPLMYIIPLAIIILFFKSMKANFRQDEECQGEN